MIPVINVLFILILISCNSEKENKTNKTNCEYVFDEPLDESLFITINNMTNEPIFIANNYNITNINFRGQEKIYYCSEPINFIDISGHIWVDFITQINKTEAMEIPIKIKIAIDNTKFRYVLNDDRSIEKIYDGKCDKISFCLFYTKKPLIISGYGYKAYVNEMKKTGFFVMGYQEGDRLVFNIIDHQRINEETGTAHG